MISENTIDILEELKIKEPEIYKRLRNSLLYDESKHYSNLNSISHDLLNYLSTLNNSFQYISTKYPASSEFKFWSNIGNSAQLAIDYISEFYMCRHCHFPEKKLFSINNLLFQLPDEADSLFLDYNRNFSFDLKDDYMVNGDYEHLLTAFMAIISNAIEATTENASITISSCLNNSNNLSITFSNPGTISYINPDDNPDCLKQLFYTSKPEHHGIGLYLCNQILLNHNGRLKIKEESDQTFVTVILPVELEFKQFI